MKIAITAKTNELESEVDPRFGRCRYFLVIDINSMEFDLISNESAMASGGAGIQAAQTLAKTGVKLVITGNIGPNAFKTLSAAGIKIYTNASGSIKEAIEKYKKGELIETESASVGSHFGMGDTGRGFKRGR